MFVKPAETNASFNANGRQRGEESVRNKIKVAIKEKLPTGPEGEILLAARAWAISGTNPL